ncbi:MAG: C40 family peptidase [Chitinophagaceae bacterium]|nr:C40 family peptidase [Chitinophagaceae bacterium]
MIRNLFIASLFLTLLAGCATMKPTGTANNKPAASKSVNSAPKPAETKKNDVKFLDQITLNNQVIAAASEQKSDVTETATTVSYTETKSPVNQLSTENFSSLQLKYSQLMGVEPEMIENSELIKSIDYWYGTRYQMGGMTKSGIDCSAFVQAVYLSAFAMAIPRTAFEQFRVTNRISAVEMKEGDLVFFNTTGGVSHVGIYLGNNKFVHASSSKGVTISDLFETYYLKRFLGVGRITKPMSNR